jgi:transposase
MVLLSARGMDVPAIAKVAFTSEDRVRDVIRNFNADGFDSLYPKYGGGRPPKFTLPQRREVKKIAKSRPGEHSLPFSAWSLSKLAEFLVAAGVADNISLEGLRTLLREEGVSFQRITTWKSSKDPDYEARKPHRGAVHGPSVLRSRWHRPRQPPRAGQHDPPLYHLAQQPRLRRTPAKPSGSLLRMGETPPARATRWRRRPR